MYGGPEVQPVAGSGYRVRENFRELARPIARMELKSVHNPSVLVSSRSLCWSQAVSAGRWKLISRSINLTWSLAVYASI